MGKFICSGELDFTIDYNIAEGVYIFSRRNHKDIVFTQFYIRRSPVDNFLKINRQHSYILVFHFAEKLRAVEESVLLESVGNLYEVAKCLHLVVYSIIARTENRTAHLYSVVILVDCSAHFHNVAVVKTCVGKISRFHYGHGLGAVGNAVYRNTVGIRSSLHPAGILKEVLESFATLQFIDTGTLDLTAGFNQTVICRHNNHVAFLKTNVIGTLTVEQIIINIRSGNLASVAHHLYRTERAGLGSTTGIVQRVEQSRKRRYTVSTGRNHLTHDIHLNSAQIAKGKRNIGAVTGNICVLRCEQFLDNLVGLVYAHAESARRI